MKNPTGWASAALGAVLLWFAPSLAALAQEEVEGHRGFMAAKGRVTYRVYCSNCHGADAKGKGNLAQYLTVQPSDLTRLSVENGGELPRDLLHEVIDGRRAVRGHGGHEMPIWGDVFQHSLSEQAATGGESGEDRAKRKIAELVLYVETLQEGIDAKPDDEPEAEAGPGE